MRRIILFGLISWAILSFLAFWQTWLLSDKKLHLIFCNVGQGDAIFVRTSGGSDILIDGGPDEKVLDCLSRHMPFFDRDLEAVFLTHPDADHLTGLIPIIKSYNIKYFGTSNAPKDTMVLKELNDTLTERKVEKHIVSKGDMLKTSDGFVMQVLWPTRQASTLASVAGGPRLQFNTAKITDTNYYSLIQLIKYRTFQALLTGDIPSSILNNIMPTLGNLQVFKPPHHGSKTGIDEFTFQHLVPQFAAISVGKKNRYHHPSPDVLNLLNKYRINFERTDEKGDIEVISDGKTWQVKK